MKPAFHERPITYRDPADLSIHERIKGDPRLDKSDPRLLAMEAAWLEAGTLPPLYVTAEGKIADGRHRWWFARKYQLERVPVIEITEDEVATIVVSALGGRNHLSAGQRAYLAAPHLDDAFSAAQQRRLDLLKAGGRKAGLAPVPNVEALAQQLGISATLLKQARRIHEAFRSSAKSRAEFEPLILKEDGCIGLGAVIAGLAGREATAGKARPAKRNSDAHNYGHAWGQIAKLSARWSRWKAEDRDAAAACIREHVAALPTELLDVIAAALRTARRAAKDEAPE